MQGIRKGGDHIKRATIYDIAHICGVSPRTVTRAFRENTRISAETRARILEAAEKNGYKPNIAATRLAKPSVHIVVLIHSIPIFSGSMEAGFRQAYEQLCDFKAELEVLKAHTSKELEDCCHRLDEMLQAKACDGLIVAAGNQPFLAEVLKRYRAANIPIVRMMDCFDSREILFYVRNDYAMSARMACEMLSLTVQEGPVIVFSGRLTGNTIHPEICAHFQEEALRRKLHVAEIFDMQDDPGYAAGETEKVLHRHPDTKGIYITSANSLSILDVLKGMEQRYTIITSDIFPELASYISEGRILASIYQNEARQARLAYQHLYEAIANGQEVPSMFTVKPQLILQSNLEAFISGWEKDLL